MKKIGWIGTGTMGHAMVVHIINAGYEVYVWNRTKSKTDDLVVKWAIYCENIWELTNNSDIVFSIIGDPKNVEQVYFWEDGILKNISSGNILVDMTTTKPSLAEKIYEAGKEKWVSSLDAPVSWGEIWAVNGTLSIMAWGEKDIFEKIYPFFELMGKTTVYCGWPGAWQRTKMANQISIGLNTIAVCESLIYAEKSGLDIEKTIAVISGWAAGSWAWNNLAPKIKDGELHTNFFIRHFVKDMRILLEECQNMNITLPGIALVHQLYTAMIAHEDEDLGTQALVKILRKMNNM